MQLGLSFDGIATGFLGSEKQIAMVIDMVERLSGDDTLVLVDPVMGTMAVFMPPIRRKCARK